MRNIVVIDLNVFVRALLTSGIDRIIYDAIKEERIIPAFCPDMFRNLADVLIRPHLKLQLKDIKELLEIIKTKAITVKTGVTINACRDASDNIIIETAVASNAKAIITNDPDLLVLQSHRDIPILTPRQFLKKLNRL